MIHYALVAVPGFIVAWMLREIVWHVVATAGVTLLHRPGRRLSRGKSGVAATGASIRKGVISGSLRGETARTTAPRPFKYGSKT